MGNGSLLGTYYQIRVVGNRAPIRLGVVILGCYGTRVVRGICSCYRSKVSDIGLQLIDTGCPKI